MKLKLVHRDQVEDLDLEKLPKTDSEHVGVEIEFISPCDDFQLTQAFGQFDVLEYIELKTDPSIGNVRSYEAGWEIAVCAPRKAIYNVLERTCKALKLAKARVNHTCGLHVHLDTRNRDRHLCFQRLYFSQNLLYSLNPDRRWNQACLPTSSPLIQESMLRDSRPGVNSCSEADYHTIEIRIHEATLNSQDINNWIKLLHRIIQSDVYYSTTTLNDYTNRLKLPPQLKNYVTKRLKQKGVKPDRLKRIAA